LLTTYLKGGPPWPAKSTTIAVATAATDLLAGAPDAYDLNHRKAIVHNPDGGLSPAPIYVGGPGVTTTDGIPVAAGARIELDLGPGDSLHAVVASGSITVRVLHLGL
jgi:hypothetical protein